MSKFVVIALVFAVAAAYWRILDAKQVQSLAPDRVSGTVRYVIDGDTLILSRSERRLRLWGVGCPRERRKGLPRG